MHSEEVSLFIRLSRAYLLGWFKPWAAETIAMVERYSKSLKFDNALQLYKQVNGGEVRG